MKVEHMMKKNIIEIFNQVILWICMRLLSPFVVFNIYTSIKNINKDILISEKSK